MIKYPKFLEAGAAKDTGAINCVVSLPDSGVSGCSLSLGRIIKVYSSLRICLTLNSVSGGRGAEGGPQSHQETHNKTWCHHWPIRGQRWGQVTNERPRPVRARCSASGQESLRDWDKSRSGSGSVSSGPPTPADTESHESCLNTWALSWVQSRSIQDLWTVPAFRGDVLWPTKTWQITNNYPDYKVGRHKNSLKTLFTISLHSNPPRRLHSQSAMW